MKYVRHKRHGMILFPDRGDSGLWHRHMARRLNEDNENGIISAGFVKFIKGGVVCTGYSESLNLGPAKDDNEVLRNHFQYAGFKR